MERTIVLKEDILAALAEAGVEPSAAKIAAAVESLHSTALVQTVCVLIGIGICFLLPTIYPKKVH